MNKPGEDKKEETPFNMAMLFYMRLNSLIDLKDRAALEEDLHGWYRALRTIYRNVSFKIDDTEKTALDKLFKNVTKVLTIPPITDAGVKGQILSLSRSRGIQQLDKIDIKLMDLMDQKKMILPRIEVTPGLKNLFEKFNLKK